MENINKEFYEDYCRWLKEIGDDIYCSPYSLGIYDVLRAHYLLIDYFSNIGEGVGGVGPKDINLLHSALSRQHCGFEQTNKWDNPLEICATLFWGLIKNHPFHDANKRTAFLSLIYHLKKINRTPTCKQKDIEILAIRIAANELSKYSDYSDKSIDPEVHFVARFLHKNTRKTDKVEYKITYRELDRILKGFGYKLDNHDRDRIQVIKITREKSTFSRSEKIIESSIGSISFRGWNRFVNMDLLRQIRRKLGLVPENGVDSKAFYKGYDPLYSLIIAYEEPLKRLSDK
jgi:prophage maintenance system killer protein